MAESGAPLKTNSPRFAPGDNVRVRKAYPLGHCRTPFYFRGASGLIERYCGDFPNPEELAYGRSGLPKVSLYRVRSRLADLWSDYRGPPQDTIEVEVFEHWLEPAEPGLPIAKEADDE